ncbi:hypothetical protein PT974_03265 [Cladobotryum mycophilum]|uniref:Uncharacterized protein n=1 Tax=Cladobotryum mycophilum TaxID=491253 RepID=A0ABR0SRY8_9HYPO
MSNSEVLESLNAGLELGRSDRHVDENQRVYRAANDYSPLSGVIVRLLQSRFVS